MHVRLFSKGYFIFLFTTLQRKTYPKRVLWCRRPERVTIPRNRVHPGGDDFSVTVSAVSRNSELNSLPDEDIAGGAGTDCDGCRQKKVPVSALRSQGAGTSEEPSPRIGGREARAASQLACRLQNPQVQPRNVCGIAAQVLRTYILN